MKSKKIKVSNFYLKREKFFSKITSNFKHTKFSDFLVAYKIPNNIQNKLLSSARVYLKECKNYKLKNMTPNGMLIPKKEVQHHYSKFVVNYHKLLINMNLDKIILKCYFPALRFKSGRIDARNKRRATRSELPHADCWAGWGNNNILIQIPLIGDVKKNKVSYFETPKNINSRWLNERDFISAQKIYFKPKLIKHHYKIGYIYISDITTLHKTSRSKNSYDRLSVDIPLLIKSKKKNVQKFISAQGASMKKMGEINKKIKLVTSTRMGQFYSRPGIKSSTSLRFKKL